MELREIKRPSTDETGKQITLILKGRVQKRIFRKENGVQPKTNEKPAIRIKHHSKVKYSPPPIVHCNPEYVSRGQYTDCQYFTIMSINSDLSYAAIVSRDTEVMCYIPNVLLSRPGLYRFRMPMEDEKFEMCGKVKIYRVRIIEQIGM